MKSSDAPSLPNERLIEARDRGGLWTMKPCVYNIFDEIERYFHVNIIDKFQHKIDGLAMVEKFMANNLILTCWSKVRNDCAIPVKKELSLNLLHEILTFIVRARTFSHVKQIMDKHKMESKK